MTLAELALIVVVGLFVLKPADLVLIAKSFKNFLSYIGKLKNELFSALDESETPKDQEQINNYLAKIIHISGKYEGKYDLPSIKAYYHRLLLEQNITKHSD